MSSIVLTTLNARYWHSSFGLRYLLANMGDLTPDTRLLEFGINDRSVDIVSEILQHDPVIVGIGVYIWNVEPASRLVADLKAVRPDLVIVLGGPEVSYEWEDQPIVELADYVVTGEADRAFPELCRRLLGKSVQDGTTSLAEVIPSVIHGGSAELSVVQLPYHLYSDEDIRHRVIYVEVSRGCPFTCEFCLSALDIPVRLFDVDAFLNAMDDLLQRGARQFKFVDRTFNLNLKVSARILQFFLDRQVEGLFLHFEMIPDRLPSALRELIQQFPAGCLQFEIGVQTFNDEVGRLISRRQDNDQLADNFRFLREHTGVHVHADLIVGLPGESVESFAAGFDRLVALEPQEIQVGILKRLKGTPIIRHDDEWQMVYSPSPPFEILSNRLIDFATMHRLRRFARYWDLVANSGNFNRTLPLIWQDGSPFNRFLVFADWLYQTEQKTHGISLIKLLKRLFEFLTLESGLSPESVAPRMLADYAAGGRRDIPQFLRPYHDAGALSATNSSLPRRQARHLNVPSEEVASERSQSGSANT